MSHGLLCFFLEPEEIPAPIDREPRQHSSLVPLVAFVARGPSLPHGLHLLLAGLALCLIAAQQGTAAQPLLQLGLAQSEQRPTPPVSARCFFPNVVIFAINQRLQFLQDSPSSSCIS